MVGVDGSEESWAAFAVAIELAGELGAGVTAVHVEHLPALSTFGLGATLGDVFEENERVRQELVALANERASGVDLDVIIHQGRPADELLAVVESTGADLLVVGHRGHGGARRWMGSVASDVVHHAPCSVLVAR